MDQAGLDPMEVIHQQELMGLNRQAELGGILSSLCSCLALFIHVMYV